jgi:L-threonylcarbamoyladenylate synthase
VTSDFTGTSSPVTPDKAQLAEAAARIRAGGLVAFPTETVYGLGANALDPAAVARIYEAKGRPAWNPVIVHVADIASARALTSAWSDDAQRLADEFWPGPLTLVLPRSAAVPDIVTAGLGNVGLRVPNHPVALALLRAAGVPIAAPSANRFTAVSPTTAQHVVDSLGSRVDLILDGGPCDVGIESTVVDLSVTPAVVLRPGMLSRDRIERALGREVDYRSDVTVDVTLDSVDSTVPQPAPGMAARHYAPRADVWLLDPDDTGDVNTALAERQNSATIAAVRPRALLIHLPNDFLATTPPGVDVQRMPALPDLYARELYAALRQADTDGVPLLLVELPPRHDAWTAVRDRLRRAAR